jgi:hypothetical protein
MWNSRKHAAVAIVGAGLAVAAATPACAWWPWYGSYYGAAYGMDDDGPYTIYRDTDYAAYGYAGRGRYYGSIGWSGCSGYDYGPAYGYAGYSDVRPWRAYGCGWAAYHLRGSNCDMAGRRPAGYAIADAPRSHGHVYAVAKLYNPATRPVHNNVAYRPQNLKLAHKTDRANAIIRFRAQIV